jgi:CubicO group peptidase (beta-lactamase class C family)
MQSTARKAARGNRILSLAIACLLGASCVEGAVVFPGKTWAEATPESLGFDSVRLKAAVADLEREFSPAGTSELVIVRDGYLIWSGLNCDAYHQIFSCTKVFTSTVLGLLIDDRKCDPGDLAIRYLPALDVAHPQYAKLQLRHLATMTGGYQGLVRDVTAEQAWGDLLGYQIPQSPRFEAGSACAYHDHDVFLLSRILTGLAEQPLKELFRRRIADPIGMKRWDWGVVGGLGDGVALNNAAGTPARNPGVQTTTLDLARLGYLYLKRPTTAERCLRGRGNHESSTRLEPTRHRRRTGLPLRLLLVDEWASTERPISLAGAAAGYIRSARRPGKRLLRGARMEHGDRAFGRCTR